MAQITIKDLASRLNIAPSTVSRALRNHPDISPQTKKSVLALASELDYFPNSIAQSLQKKSTNTIGVIVPEIKHDFFALTISGIENIAYEAGYTIMVCQSNENYEREVINTQALVSNRIAGLLVSISETTRDSGHFQTLLRRGIPVVFFDRVCEDPMFMKVMVDDEEGAYQAVRFLIENGHRRIAHLAGPSGIPMSRNRFKGYAKALREYGIPMEEQLVVYGGLHEEYGMKGFQKLMELHKLPDAIFAVNDPVAVGAYVKIKENGLKIPDDISLVGFSDNPISSLIEPPLTTVAQPAYNMGITAAKLLLEQINQSGNGMTPKTEILKTHLKIRKSTRIKTVCN